MTATFIDSFTSGLEELPRRKQRDPDAVLAVLRAAKRFSVFEATANSTIARMMEELQRLGRISTDNSCGYPWINVTAIDGVPL